MEQRDTTRYIVGLANRFLVRAPSNELGSVQANGGREARGGAAIQLDTNENGSFEA